MSRYVIVDLEMCKVKNAPGSEQSPYRTELIQIGAVLLDETLEICDSFVTLVCPEYGFVDQFIENLTGISRSSTKDAPPAAEAIEAFYEWLPEDAVLVSWSRSDEKQIRLELAQKNIDIPGLDKYLDNWIDCQETFAQKMNSGKAYKLSEALIITGIYYEDGEHDALVDARNTAMLFAKMEREQELQLSPYYLNSVKEPPAYNPFAALLKNKDFGE